MVANQRRIKLYFTIKGHICGLLAALWELYTGEAPPQKEQGQALVETALIAPLLVFMLIGVFETGYALRGYLVLINANREAARFAIRPDYLDYTPESYQNIYVHALDSIQHQIEFTKGGTIIISVIDVDTGQVCDKTDLASCDCDVAVTNPYTPTLIMTPLTYPTMTWTYPATSTELTHLNYVKQADDMVTFNRRLNCEIMKRGGEPLDERQVTVEMIWAQSQLFGFPIISNPFTDPVPMYSHTTVRKVNSRYE